MELLRIRKELQPVHTETHNHQDLQIKTQNWTCGLNGQSESSVLTFIQKFRKCFYLHHSLTHHFTNFPGVLAPGNRTTGLLDTSQSPETQRPLETEFSGQTLYNSWSCVLSSCIIHGLLANKWVNSSFNEELSRALNRCLFSCTSGQRVFRAKLLQTPSNLGFGLGKKETRTVHSCLSTPLCVCVFVVRLCVSFTRASDVVFFNVKNSSCQRRPWESGASSHLTWWSSVCEILSHPKCFHSLNLNSPTHFLWAHSALSTHRSIVWVMNHILYSPTSICLLGLVPQLSSTLLLFDTSPTKLSLLIWISVVTLKCSNCSKAAAPPFSLRLKPGSGFYF